MSLDWLHPEFARKPSTKVVAGIFGFLSCIIAAIGLYGWASGNELLQSFSTSSVTMKPNTAISILLLGVTVIWRSLVDSHSLAKYVAVIFAACASLIGALSLSQYIFSTNLGIDQLLFVDHSTQFETTAPGRMSIISATSFMMVGVALILETLAIKRFRYWADALLVPSLFFVIFVLLGHIFDDPGLRGLGSTNTMAINTALGTLCACVGAFALNPAQRVIAPLLSPTPAGTMLRWVLPPAASLPVVFGWIRCLGEREGYYSTAVGVALTVAMTIALVSVIIFLGASAVQRVINRAAAAEAAARENDRQLRALLDASLTSVHILDRDGKFIYANPQTARELHCEPSEITGKEVESLLTEEQSVGFMESIEEIWRTKQHTVSERIVGKGRNARIYLTDRFPIRNEAGEPTAVGSISYDVTDLRKAEADIKRFFDLTPNLLCIATLDGEFVTLNPMWERATGFSLAELKSRPFLDFVHPDDRESTIAAMSQLDTGVDVIAFENRYVCKDGSYRTLLWNSAPSIEFGLVYAAAVDVTERNRRDAELALDLVRMQALLDLHEVDVASREKIVEFALKASLRITASEFAAIGLFDAADENITIYSLDASDSEGVIAPRTLPLADAPAIEEFVRNRNAIVINKRAQLPESLSWIPGATEPRERILAVPVVEGNQVVAIAAVSNKASNYGDSDTVSLKSLMNKLWLILSRQSAIEAVKQLNEDLTSQSRALRSANRELEAFSYSVSHDLRAPLRSIDGFCQALLDDYSDAVDEVGQDYLRRVRSATQRMGQLIDDLLRLSRVTRSPLHRETVDLSRLANTIVDELRKRTPDRSVEVDVESGIVVNGDQTLLTAVLENLIGNAWKYSSAKHHAKIEVRSCEVQGVRAVYVRDDGAGFDMNYADKLFNPFQRLHPIDQFEGTGVGLATVQRIIRRHGGEVWAEGEVDRGATFYFTLEPIDRPGGNNEAQDDLTGRGQSGRRRVNAASA